MQDFKNINVANPFNSGNETWAVCYLKREGDERNVLKLDNKRLSIVKRGRQRVFVKDDIENLTVGHKRLLLPLILGGVLAPLSLIAIYENAYSPFLLLTSFFIGILLLYLGWNGSDVISLHLKKDRTEQVFVRNIPGQVKRFIQFINLFISNSEYSDRPYFYHVYTRQHSQEVIDFTDGPDQEYLLLTEEEFGNYGGLPEESAYIKIDPRKLTSPVKLSYFPDGQSGFTVRSINQESIVKE